MKHIMDLRKKSNKKHVVQLSILMGVSVALTGCFDDDDDNGEPFVTTAPQAASVDLITQTNTPIVDQAPGSDVDGLPLSYTLDSQPTNGSIDFNSNGQYTYTPFDETVGSDTFNYTASDLTGLSASGTINITIENLQVSFLDYSREAFEAEANDEPLPINNRTYTQDVSGESDYQDLIDGD